jgi:hypothetical protein
MKKTYLRGYSGCGKRDDFDRDEMKSLIPSKGKMILLALCTG